MSSLPYLGALKSPAANQRIVKNSNGTFAVTKSPESERKPASSDPGDVPKGTVNAAIWHGSHAHSGSR
jgi:hypothetical protein